MLQDQDHLVEDITSGTLIAALHRFITRKGKIKMTNTIKPWIVSNL